MQLNGIYQKIISYKELPFQLIVYDEKAEEDLHVFPKHWHEHLEITATICGKGEAWIDGKIYQIRDKNVFIINPGALHKIEGAKPYKENTGFCLQIDMEYFYPLLPSLRKRYDPTCEEEISRKILLELIKLRNEIEEEKDRFTLLVRIIKILKILNEQKTMEDIPVETEKHKQLVLSIAKYIENTYDERLEVKTLAEHFQISPSYFHKLFKTYFQQSVHQYIMERRMLHAIEDLKYTDFSILDISLKNGFADQKAFTRQFKKRFGITPSAYRKKRENSPVL